MPIDIHRRPASACIVLLAAGLVAGPALAQTHAAASPVVPVAHKVALDTGKLSYAIGYQFGGQFADGHPDIDVDTLVRALEDAYAKRPPTVPVQVMREQLMTLDRQMHSEALAAYRKLAAENARKSAQFMLRNGDQPGVVSLPSGVQYKVLRAGNGTRPTTGSTVVVNYRGALIDGMEFDNSYADDHAVTFPVSQMLPGWQDVLPRMRVCAKWKVFIPPAQAYGERGQLPRIGPNEVLVFEIELLGVK
jgi:FKBP-type peptidyl-prolyl cis-trans isomerase FklB